MLLQNNMIFLNSHLTHDPAVIKVLSAVLLVIIGLAVLYVIRIHIAYVMAKNRHRDTLPWILLSFFFSPLITWILLLVMGDAKTDRPSNY